MLLPSKELFNGTKTPVTTTAEMRVALGQLRDYLAALLGEDSDETSAERGVLSAVGLGTTNTSAYAADIDDATLVAGLYCVDASTVGAFPGGVVAATSFLVHRVYGSAGFQLLNLPLSNRTFIRARVSSAWGTWSELLSSDKVVTPATDAAFADNSGNPASTSWVRGAMSAIATAAGFVFSVNPTGYIKLPSWLGGFIMQWGSTSSIAVNGSVTTALPLTFPNSHLISLAVLNTANAAWVGVSSKTLSNVTIANSNASSNPTSAFFLSIGN